MTLVVARIDGDKIYIESDSRITDQRLVKSDPLCGLLKTLILHPFVCLSFAGNVDYAEKAIKKIFERKNKDLNDLLSILLEINIESENSTDFLVASIIGRIPKLFKISDRAILTDTITAWIGDIDGFELYQESYHSDEDSLSIEERMAQAFKSVLENPTINTVADFQISTNLDYDINPNHPVFIYKLSVELRITEPQVISFEKVGQFQSIPLGTVEGGSHGVSYLRTVCPDFHGVAIHFIHGSLGIFFCPQIDFKGIIFSEISGRDFVDKIKKDFGIPLQGFIRNSSTSIQLIDTR